MIRMMITEMKTNADDLIFVNYAVSDYCCKLLTVSIFFSFKGEVNPF